jgi:hypothetical protein
MVRPVNFDCDVLEPAAAIAISDVRTAISGFHLLLMQVEPMGTLH